MADPYKIDPSFLKAITKQVEEERLITLKDDSTRPPPTIGTPSWRSSLFGPMLGQPESSFKTFAHESNAFRTSFGFLAAFVILGVILYHVQLLFL